MEAYTQQFIEWLQALSPMSIYVIFAVIAYTENVVPPIPGDILVAFGGYLAAEQIIGFNNLLVVTTIASVIGFMNMYWIGAYFGDQIEKKRSRFWLMRVVDVKYYDKAKRWMDRWGMGVILANRFLAGTRSVISVTAGITKTKVYSTIICSTISSVLWNFILIALGWLIHENWQIIGHYLNIYGRIILVLIVVIVIAKLAYNRFKRGEKKT